MQLRRKKKSDGERELPFIKNEKTLSYYSLFQEKTKYSYASVDKKDVYVFHERN
jgi:hypothetical protein